jgi:hypothetical protein
MIERLIERFGPVTPNVALGAVAGIACGAIALLYDNWVRDWLFFVCGFNLGSAFYWLMFRSHWNRQREKMREEMNEIGADIVRRMHDQQMANPYPYGLPPPDEPPRMH